MLGIVEILGQGVPPLAHRLLLVEERQRHGSGSNQQTGLFSPAQQQQRSGQKTAADCESHPVRLVVGRPGDFSTALWIARWMGKRCHAHVLSFSNLSAET